MKTAVVIHAQFLPLAIWEQVMWGRPKEGTLGVIPTGLRLALQEEASLVYWCQGIPHKGGRTISPDALEYAINHAGELPEYTGMSADDIRTALTSNAVLDIEAQVTREEMQRAAVACQQHGIERVFLVSPPKHIFRVHQEALLLSDTLFRGIQVFPLASGVDFPNTTAGAVVMVEPPHRADQPLWQTHRYAAATFQIMKQGETPFEQYLAEWGSLLQKFGVSVTWQPKL